MADELSCPEAKDRAEELKRARVIISRRPANDAAGYGVLRSTEIFTFRGISYPGSERGDYGVDKPLPVDPDHEDFAWADECLGLFMINHDDVLVQGAFVLPESSRWPVARLLYRTPTNEWIADVITSAKLAETAEGDSLDFAPPGMARIEPAAPDIDGAEEWRDRDIRAWMADFYSLRYGDYLIGMNTTEEGTYRENTFELEVPDDIGMTEALDLVSGETVDVTAPLTIEPHSTVILYVGE